MATPLDVGLIQHFSIIFPFLLTFVVVYGVLLFSKSFGENKGLIGFFALVTSFMVLLSSTIREVINTMVPWFVLVFIFVLFGLTVFKIFGATDADITGVIRSLEFRSIIVWFTAISIIIGIGSIAYIFGQRGETPFGYPGQNATISGSSEEITGTGTTVFWKALVHPKVLGVIVLLLIGMFTIMRLTVSFPPERI